MDLFDLNFVRVLFLLAIMSNSWAAESNYKLQKIKQTTIITKLLLF